MNSNSRIRKDAELIKTKACPAAGANADCDSIDLEAVELYPASDGIEVRLSMPATATLVSGKVLTFTFQDSADNLTFAGIEELATFTVTGTGGNVSAAKEVIVKLPPTTKRYINVNCSCPADAGTNTAYSYTFELIF